MVDITEKINSESCISYWEDLHRHTIDIRNRKYDSSKLDAICCPGSPYLYNKLIDHFQKICFQHCLKVYGPLTGKRVLDVGCGTGRWSRFMAAQGASVTGIDLSLDVVRFNQNHFKGIDFKAMEVTKLEFSDNSFDFVTSVTVLQHIPYPDQDDAISEICRTVKMKGHIIILEKICSPKVEKEEFERGVTFPNRPTEWIEKFNRNGCLIVKTERHLFFPLINNVYFPLKKYISRVIKIILKKESIITRYNKMTFHQELKKSNFLDRLDLIIHYYLMWFLTPISFLIEYPFVYLMKSCTKQSLFGNSQAFVFKKER